MSSPSLHDIATQIFGSEDAESIRRWVDYWARSEERNTELLASFRRLALLDFNDKTVLDVGCGTGGMARVIGRECRQYVGVDFHAHVLRVAPETPHSAFLQADGRELPFADETFDYIIAFDVIEHLVGGETWQLQFLEELRRVLKPLGMVLLTTPNWWYPYEAHSDLYFTQYLPVWLADRYIAWKRPGFLEEHHSFREIQILSPRALRRCLRRAQLSFLHQLPCGLDRSDYAHLFPLRSPLLALGLGWYPHAEFWGILARQESRELLRLKLPKNWYYEQHQPSTQPVLDFAPLIDFQEDAFGRQLGEGWFWHEQDRMGFRWTRRHATCFLQGEEGQDYLELTGFSPYDNYFDVEVDGVRVGEHWVGPAENFSLRFLLPFAPRRQHIFQVSLRCEKTHRPKDHTDDRDLGLMMFSLGLAS